MKCPNCQKAVKQTPGKREKVFCNSTCRSNYWAKEKRKADVSRETEMKKVYGPVIKMKTVNKPVFRQEGMPKGLSLTQQIDWKIKNGK